MRDRRMEDAVDMTQKTVLIYFDLLRCLLDKHHLGSALVEPALAVLNLKEPVLVGQLHAHALLRGLQKRVERHLDSR